jgi:hypothetical protein
LADSSTASPKVSNTGKWIGVTLAATLGAALTGPIGVIGAVALATSTSSPVGKEGVKDWNYQEEINTTFDPATGVCTRIRTYKNCAKIKKNYCETWEEPKEVRDEVTLL